MKSKRIKLTSPKAFMDAFNRCKQLQENEDKKSIENQNIPTPIANG